MESKQEDRLNMYYEVMAVAEKWRPVWESNSVFSAAYTEFDTILTSIEKNRDAQLVTTKSSSSEKSNVWDSLFDKIMFLSKRIQSYANTTKNIQLFNDVHISATKLNYSRDSNFTGICHNIIASATANLAALEPYSVTNDNLLEIQALLDRYQNIKTKPRSVRAEIKTATENIVSNFKVADALLSGRLDLDIEVFKSTNHDFYSQYHSARMINATGSKTSLLVIRVVSAASKLPIENALCTVSLQSDSSVHVSKKTAKQGILHVPNLAEGIYSVKVEKIGMASQDVSFVMEKGRSMTVFVAL
jgi:hypothetical protein